jgi:hypothetical protein
MLCEICGKEFQGKRSSAKYCSPKCRKLAFLSVPNKNDKTLSVPVSVPEKPVSVLSVPCENCVTLQIKIKKLLAEIALLKLDLQVREEKSAWKPVEDVPKKDSSKPNPYGYKLKPIEWKR